MKKIKGFLWLLVFLPFVWSLPFSTGTKSAAAHVQITILGTTDLHGNLLPIDYYTGKPDARGLARAATIIKRARQENPNLLLIDSGDTIQGTPLEFYHNQRNNAPIDPMMLAMNHLHYDAMAVGNHEYNFGLKVLEKARREAQFPWLSANTYEKGSDRSHFTPYIVKEIAGVRVGILGLTTPGIPNWDNAQNYQGLEFREPLSETQKWVGVLREKEQVDVVIVAMHMGLEADLKTGEINPGQVANENQAMAIAKQAPGVDVIFMGHTHRDVPSLFVNSDFVRLSPSGASPSFVSYAGVLLTQADYWGKHVARADLYLDKDEKGRWRVTAKAARTIATDDSVAADSEVVKLTEPYDRETSSWLAQPIGESSEELTANGGQFHDTAILDLVQRVQLEAGKADVSLAANFNSQARIPKGQVTVREIAGLYIYENTLVVLEVTGQQLKDALEHSAEYFRPYEAGKSATELVNEKIPLYNFDIAEGVNYELVISKPFGQRIQKLTFKGQPVRPDQKFRLATNNYRSNGGGGYTMLKTAPVVYRSSELIRDLIIDWVERNKTVPAKPNNNWRLLP